MGAVAARRFTDWNDPGYHDSHGAAGIGIMAAGDALAGAFMASREPLLRYLRARGAGDEAEDLLQELWIKLGGLDETVVADPTAYLYRMAHNLMLDRLRAGHRRRRREEDYGQRDESDDAPAIERTLIARERLRHVDRALAALGARTDSIFRRYRVEGVAQRDIAAALGISLSAVEKHLQRAYRAVAAAQAELSGDACDRDEGATDAPR